MIFILIDSKINIDKRLLSSIDVIVGKFPMHPIVNPLQRHNLRLSSWKVYLSLSDLRHLLVNRKKFNQKVYRPGQKPNENLSQSKNVRRSASELGEVPKRRKR